MYGEVKQSEKRRFVELGRVDSEHGHEWRHGLPELAAAPLRGLGEAPDVPRRLDPQNGVVQLQKLQRPPYGHRRCLRLRWKTVHKLINHTNRERERNWFKQATVVITHNTVFIYRDI